jgi:hypothetical protein
MYSTLEYPFPFFVVISMEQNFKMVQNSLGSNIKTELTVDSSAP